MVLSEEEGVGGWVGPKAMKETWGWVDHRVHYIKSACKEKIHARGGGISVTVQFHQNTQVYWLLHTWSDVATGLVSRMSIWLYALALLRPSPSGGSLVGISSRLVVVLSLQ